MRITTYQLRQIVLSPTRFIARTRTAPSVSGQFGNPQRAWMEAAWRAYFAAGRDDDALWQMFERKVKSGNMTPRRATLAEGAVPMLDQFLLWDGDEARAPHLWHLPSTGMTWGRHVLSLKRDAVYLTESGYLVRLFWTDRDLAVGHPEAPLMVAGILAYSDVDLGEGRVDRIEVWHLRDGQQRAWNRLQLLVPGERLRDRLNAVAAALEE